MRALMPGRWSHDKARAIPTPACLGACELYGRPCTCYADTELANVVPLRPLVQVRPAITVHRIPMRRRVRRFVRALWAFLTASRFRP